MQRTLLREPMDAALGCGSAGVIASANIGCYVQISKHLGLQGLAVPVLHPMQLLDMAMRGERLDQLAK